jgi:squalene cyclase
LCQAVPDERTALETEIVRLQSDNAALKKELLAHALPLPEAIKPDLTPGRVEEPRLQLPSDAEFNQMMGFIEKVWRRLVEMVVSVQRDLMKKT